MIARIIIGFLMVGIGFLFVWKSEWLLYNVGRNDWAEQKLSGGSRFFYKLVGIGVIFVGFLVITNIHTSILTAFASLFIRT